MGGRGGREERKRRAGLSDFIDVVFVVVCELDGAEDWRIQPRYMRYIAVES